MRNFSLLGAVLLPIASFVLVTRGPDLPPPASADQIQQAIDRAERDRATARSSISARSASLGL